MKTPEGLVPLIEDGVIDEVIRPLKSGKEATVYLVRSGEKIRCAKVYRNMAQRSFQKRAHYQEGRKVRGSRQTRALQRAIDETISVIVSPARSTSVVPCSEFNLNSRSMMAAPVAASRLPVGSSAMRIFGSTTKARARATRCCSPPDKCRG